MSEKTTSFEEKLRAVIETIDIANALSEPLIESIRDLLAATAAELGSEEASVLIKDTENGDLRFLTAIGKVAHQLVDLKVPAGKGIAGFVFSSGQPMAVADAGEEETFYAEVDRRTGYSTQTILATPLFHNEEIIGVLEYVNRIGDPPYEGFTPDEMDKAARFAEPIASLVSAYESAKNFQALSGKMLSAEKSDFSDIRQWLGGLRDSSEHREMIELAALLREIAVRGQAERRMCRELLEAVLNFSESRRESGYLNL